MTTPRPLSIDLFCGAGGLTEGFRQGGFECVYANDFNEHAICTFQENNPGVESNGQPIEELEPTLIRRELSLSAGELDCLVGGPPCQGFSINAPERFLEDPRNSLFKHYLRFLDAFQPKTFVFENVPGMMSFENGQVVQEVIRSFMRYGYDVSCKILFAAHYGVPQERWRLIIMGSRVGRAPVHPFPTHFAKRRANFTGGKTLTFQLDERTQDIFLPAVTVEEAIGDLPELLPGEGVEAVDYSSGPRSRYADIMRDGSYFVLNHVAPAISEINLKRLAHIAPGGSWRDIPFDLLPAGMKKARTSDHTRRYGRLHPEGLAGTVMTKMDPHWGPAFHYSQDRTLTVREAARFQSFPDLYTFLGPRGAQYEQVGNAVPVLMARAISESILAAIHQPTALTVFENETEECRYA